MYSIVMLAAMTAAPETQDFCCFKGGKSSQGCDSSSSSGCCNSGPTCGGNGGGCNNGYGSGYGGNGCCNKGGGYGKGCCFLGCGLFAKCCGGGYRQGGASYSQPGYGYCNSCTNGGSSYTQVVAGYAAMPYMPTQGHAEVVIMMPANGKLIANGREVLSTGSTRSFQTPAISLGQDFRYEMQIEVTKDGETETLTKQVTVRAGHRTTVDFTGKAALVTAAK